MNVRDACENILGLMVDCFHEIEVSVAPAQPVIDNGRYNWKYIEKNPEQILV